MILNNTRLVMAFINLVLFTKEGTRTHNKGDWDNNLQTLFPNIKMFYNLFSVNIFNFSVSRQVACNFMRP